VSARGACIARFEARKNARGIEFGLAVVADDEVASRAAGDLIRAIAADDDVEAVAAVDGVIAASFGLGGGQIGQNAGGVEGGAAVVTEDEVLGAAAGDVVIAKAAEDDYKTRLKSVAGAPGGVVV
jgi:hypothetical protein